MSSFTQDSSSCHLPSPKGRSSWIFCKLPALENGSKVAKLHKPPTLRRTNSLRGHLRKKCAGVPLPLHSCKLFPGHASLLFWLLPIVRSVRRLPSSWWHRSCIQHVPLAATSVPLLRSLGWGLSTSPLLVAKGFPPLPGSLPAATRLLLLSSATGASPQLPRVWPNKFRKPHGPRPP